MSVLNLINGQGYIARIEAQSFVDGEGVRCSIYVSGCPFACKGCYNEAAQNFRYGEKFNDEVLEEILQYCAPDYINGLSILGGEPFCNLDTTLRCVREFRKRFGNSKTIWIWSGFLFEYLANGNPERRRLLELIDILVDGPFMTHLYRSNLPYKGSLNQRIIDVQASLTQQQLCEYITY